MGVFAWCSRRASGLSILALIGLSYWVISQESAVQRYGFELKQSANTKGATYSSSTTASGAGIWTFIFAYYCLLIHALVFMFPLRACWSIWELTHSLKRVSQSKAMESYKDIGQRRRSSFASVSSAETLTSDQNGVSSTSSEFSDIEPELYTDGNELLSNPIIHAIIIPNYKEEMDTLKETLDVLACHPQAQSSYDVYLGMEQREAGGESKALRLIQEYSKKFRAIDYTLHPSDIAGEAAGKGSNIAWAARKLSSNYPMTIRQNVIVTGIDADSHLSSSYFAQITNMHTVYPDTALTTLYAAPIIFDRNAHNVPAVVRVADIMWCAAGMSGLYRSSSIAPPTSVYSLPLILADRVGGWDTDAEAIGEDLHMYLKCFFALNGHLTCRTVISPVSQSNVTGGGKGGIRGTIIDMKARYKQALRHMWGALDTGYALRKAAELWQDRKYTARAFRPLHKAQGNNLDVYFPESPASESELALPADSSAFSDITKDTLKEPHWEQMFYLAHRLFEAHFLPVHMTILVIASTLYTLVTNGNDDPNNLAWIFSICNVLRTLGFLEVGFYLFLYESFHRICVNGRERDMARAGLSDGMCFSHRSVKKNIIDYIMVPLVAPLYGAIPCAQAEISHFWTVDLVYAVSKKVTRQRAKSVVVEDMA